MIDMTELNEELIKIAEKIEKLLTLSANNSNDNEAQNALVKAQKLLVKHKLSLGDIESLTKKEITVEHLVSPITFKTSDSWKYHLASCIANNFGCYCFAIKSGLDKYIVFLGIDEDVKIVQHIVMSTVMYIEQNIDIKRKNAIKNKKSVRNISYNYGMGFCNGLESKFKEALQKDSQLKLAIIKHEKVEEKYNDMDITTTKSRHSINPYSKEFIDGYKDGLSRNFKPQAEITE